MKISLDNIDAFIFDFDGVMTDNFVYINQNGEETVRCSRADGLAFNVLHKLKKPSYIISTEKNPVVKKRAMKLKTEVIQGSNDKEKAVRELCSKNNYQLENLLYVGNDLNDYNVMKICGYAICPADSHSKIKKISDIKLKSNGGYGIVRDLLEDVLNLNVNKILYEL